MFEQFEAAWQKFLVELFPVSIPSTATWEKKEDIVMVINHVPRGANHMTFPGLGDMHIRGADIGIEENTIEIVLNSDSLMIVRPKKLILESHPINLQSWYLKLEAESLTWLGDYTNRPEPVNLFEDLLEIQPKELHEYLEKKPQLGKFASIFRFVGGFYYISSKGAFINR